MTEILELLKKQTTWFDIVESKGTSTPISFKNNRVHSILEKQNSGYGIRVNKSGKTGFSYSNSSDNLMETAKMALDLSKFGDDEPFSLPGQCKKSFDPYSEEIKNFSIDHEITECEKAIKEITSQFQNAIVDININKSQGSSKIINSTGFENSYINSYYSISISVSDVNEKNKIDIWESASDLKPINYEHLVKTILTKLENAHSILKTDSGKIPVIFTPKAFSRMLGIIAGGLNSKAVHKGISPFADKVDKKIFNSNFSLIDNPTLQESPYSYPFDDEGVIADKKYLIVNGVIENFIADLKYAEKLNIQPGNASRGYSTLPGPSFSNIEISKGHEQHSDLFNYSGKIILADQFIGFGQSNTLTGNFSANLDLAYVIENGKITGRIKDCMLTDNIFSLLADDVILSKNREKIGSVICPYVLMPAVNFTA